MTEFHHLIGADEVHAAGHRIASAAERMSHTACAFDHTAEQLRRTLDDFLVRFAAEVDRIVAAKDGAA